MLYLNEPQTLLWEILGGSQNQRGARLAAICDITSSPQHFSAVPWRLLGVVLRK